MLNVNDAKRYTLLTHLCLEHHREQLFQLRSVATSEKLNTPAGEEGEAEGVIPWLRRTSLSISLTLGSEKSKSISGGPESDAWGRGAAGNGGRLLAIYLA